MEHHCDSCNRTFRYCRCWFRKIILAMTKGAAMSDELLKLAERCEAATGPSVLLDAQIYHDGLGLPQPKGDEPYCPRYTASLDTAMTLVPEGWDADVTLVCHEGGPSAYLAQGYEDTFTAVRKHKIETRAATPALALCAAALRAAQEMGK